MFSRHSHRRFPGFVRGCFCGRTELYEHSHARIPAQCYGSALRILTKKYSDAFVLGAQLGQRRPRRVRRRGERCGSGRERLPRQGDSDMRQKVWPECGSGTRPTGRVHSKGLDFDHTISWSTETRLRAPNKCAKYRRHVCEPSLMTDRPIRARESQKSGNGAP